jgi:YjbE family integral membrane protein
MIDITDLASPSALLDALLSDIHEPQFWLSVLQIIWIDILLAGDNAVVIALACRNLPPHLRVWGMVLGAGVAVLLRIIFTLIISVLMTLPFLKFAGGVALFFIAIKLLIPEDGTGEADIHGSERLWQAVRIVALADIVMSLDNVIAIAAAAKGNPALFVFGLAASVPLIIAGAALVMSLLTRFPILVWAGAGLLGWIAGELIARDPVIKDFLSGFLTGGMYHAFEIAAGVAGIVIVVGLGWVLRRRHFSRAAL